MAAGALLDRREIATTATRGAGGTIEELPIEFPWAMRRWYVPTVLVQLRRLLHAQSRIESRIVLLNWVVMILVGAGAVLPARIGSGLGVVSSALVVCVLALHPLAYLWAASFGYPWLSRNDQRRATVLSAIDVSVAVGVLFLTATKPGYTQVLLFSVVLLTSTRYSIGQAVGITTLLSILQFFAILASNHQGLQITTLSSAVVAMFALTFGVNQLSQAERKEAAIAAENARLYRAVLLRNRELATINAVSVTATQDTDPDRLLESGLELILSSIPVTWGQAFRYERGSQTLELLYVRQASRIGGLDETRWIQDEAQRAARGRSVVTVKSESQHGEIMMRVSAPVLVQGLTAGVLQALMPLPEDDSAAEGAASSLTIVCQELGTSVEKAQLRSAAQRSLVLEEKNRIARELHDTVLQILFSLGLGVDWCLQRPTGDKDLEKKLVDMRRLTAQAGNELRSAIYTLSSTVAEMGLMPALDALARDFTDEHGLPVSLSSIGSVPMNLPLLTQNALHRVVRESLMNIYKHAGADHAAVRLIFEPTEVAAVVQDDGIGVPEQVLERYADDPSHFGLRTVKRQIEELQGQFEIMKGEEGGTVVRATVPVAMAPQEAGGVSYINH